MVAIVARLEKWRTLYTIDQIERTSLRLRHCLHAYEEKRRGKREVIGICECSRRESVGHVRHPAYLVSS